MVKQIFPLTLFFFLSQYGASPLDLPADAWGAIISKPSTPTERIKCVLTLKKVSKKIDALLSHGNQLKYSIGLSTDELEKEILRHAHSNPGTTRLLLSLHMQPDQFIFEQYKLNGTDKLGIKMALTQNGATLLWAIDGAEEYTQRDIEFEKRLSYNDVRRAREEDAVKKIYFAEDLINAGDQVNYAYKTSGGTPLHRALWYNRNEIVKLLIKKGANLNAATRCSLCTSGTSCTHDTITPLQRMLYQLIPGIFELEVGCNSYTASNYQSYDYQQIKIKDIYESLTPLQKILIIRAEYGFEVAEQVNKQLPATEQLSAWQLYKMKNLTQADHKEIEAKIKGVEPENSGTLFDNCTIQ